MSGKKDREAQLHSELCAVDGVGHRFFRASVEATELLQKLLFFFRNIFGVHTLLPAVVFGEGGNHK